MIPKEDHENTGESNANVTPGEEPVGELKVIASQQEIE